MCYNYPDMFDTEETKEIPSSASPVEAEWLKIDSTDQVNETMKQEYKEVNRVEKDLQSLNLNESEKNDSHELIKNSSQVQWLHKYSIQCPECGTSVAEVNSRKVGSPSWKTR